MRLVIWNSPNQSERLPGDVRIIVCHTPEGGYEGTRNYCMKPAAQVSYHVLYKKDGTEATQLVPFKRKAWHALSYNSISDGLAVEGFARLFDLRDKGTFELAKGVAARCFARGVKPQWTTDPTKGGFCRHGDLQSNRTDPTPDLGEWRLFVGMVKAEYAKLSRPEVRDWPVPVPDWYWPWARWRLKEGEFKDSDLPRPADAPTLIPAWAWRRLYAILRERQV